MLYIVTALYEEAFPFLKRYRLKQKTDFPHFELFLGESMMLLITRPGALRAATALSSMLTAFPPGEGDFLLSIGCAGCASKERIGEIFQIARITESASGRTRYPELLYCCPFPEAEVITEAQIRQGREYDGTSEVSDRNAPFNPFSLPLLYDMEAAGIYEAAIPYFSCEKLLFIKIASDPLTGLLELSIEKRREQVTNYIESSLLELEHWLLELGCFSDFFSNSFRRPILEPENEILFTQICSALRLSVTSSSQLRQLMLYLSLSGISYADSMKKLLAIPLASPCRAKKEGLNYLAKLYKFYL